MTPWTYTYLNGVSEPIFLLECFSTKSSCIVLQSVSSSYHSRTAGKIQSGRRISWLRTAFCFYVFVCQCVSAVCELCTACAGVLVETRRTHTACSITSHLIFFETGNWTGRQQVPVTLLSLFSHSAGVIGACVSTPELLRGSWGFFP